MVAVSPEAVAHRRKSKGIYRWLKREEISAYKKEYRRRNQDQLKATRRQEYLRRRERCLLANKAYREANREKVRAYQKVYRSQDAIKRRANELKRERRKRLIPPELIAELKAIEAIESEVLAMPKSRAFIDGFRRKAKPCQRESPARS